jgi:hypothetical protein
MKRTNTILAGLVLSTAASFAGSTPAPLDKNPSPPPPADPCAGPISYTNIELLYQRTNFDGNSRDDGNAGLIRFEYEAVKSLYFTLDVDRNSYDQTVSGIRDLSETFSIDQWKVSVGAGGHIALSDNIHLSGDAGFIYSDISADSKGGGIPGAVQNPDGSESGWFIRPQIRAKWKCLTVHLGGEYRDFGGDDTWSFYSRFYYQVSPHLDVTLQFATGDDADVFSGGVRWRF